MEVHVLVQSYNTFGGHSSISCIAEFLERFLDDDTCGLCVFEATLCFPSRFPAKRTLEDLYARFHAQLTALPSTRFEPKKGRFVLRYASQLGPAENMLKPGPLALPIFHAAFLELTKTMDLLRKKLAGRPGMNYAELLAGVDAARCAALAAGADLPSLLDAYKSQTRQRQAELPWWERIGIDWHDFHPDSRKLLDEEFFWSQTNDFSPHGNDTGADLLAGFMSWRPTHRSLPATAYLTTLLGQWGMAEMIARAQDRGVDDLDRNDELAITTFDEAAIALAFAQVKVEAACDNDVRQLALAAIERQADERLASHFGHSVSPDRHQALARLRQKLDEARGA